MRLGLCNLLISGCSKSMLRISRSQSSDSLVFVFYVIFNVIAVCIAYQMQTQCSGFV